MKPSLRVFNNATRELNPNCLMKGPDAHVQRSMSHTACRGCGIILVLTQVMLDKHQDEQWCREDQLVKVRPQQVCLGGWLLSVPARRSCTLLLRARDCMPSMQLLDTMTTLPVPGACMVTATSCMLYDQ